MALAHPRLARGGLGRAALPPGRVGQPAPRRGHDGHADLGRRRRGIPVVALGAVLHRRRHDRRAHALRAPAQPGRGRRGEPVPRGRLRGDHVHRRRPVLRGPREADLRSGPAGAAGHGSQGRGRPAGRPLGPDRDPYAGRPARRRRPVRGAPWREGRHRRHRGVGHVRGRRVHADRESVPVEVGPGAAVVGATVNAGGRLVVRATRVGSDTQLAQMAKLVEDAQNGKADVQRLADRVSAVFVPIVIGLALRPWLPGSCPGTPHSRVHGSCRRADHRLPLRPGPGDPDRAAGGDRARRPARHPHQGPAGPGVHPPGRHRRARQDRHGHHRPHGGHRHPPRCGPVGRRGPGHRRCPGGRLRAPDRARDRQARQRGRHRPRGGRELHRSRGNGVSGVVAGHAVMAGRRSWLADEWSLAAPEDLVRLAAAAEGEGAPRSGWPGMDRSAPWWSSPT